MVPAAWGVPNAGDMTSRQQRTLGARPALPLLLPLSGGGPHWQRPCHNSTAPRLAAVRAPQHAPHQARKRLAGVHMPLGRLVDGQPRVRHAVVVAVAACAGQQPAGSWAAAMRRLGASTGGGRASRAAPPPLAAQRRAGLRPPPTSFTASPIAPAAKPRVCCAARARLPSWLRSRAPTRPAARARDCMAAIGLRWCGCLAPCAALPVARSRLSLHTARPGAAAADLCQGTFAASLPTPIAGKSLLAWLHGCMGGQERFQRLEASHQAWIGTYTLLRSPLRPTIPLPWLVKRARSPSPPLAALAGPN